MSSHEYTRARSVARAPRVIPVSPRAPREISPGARGVSSPAPRARPPARARPHRVSARTRPTRIDTRTAVDSAAGRAHRPRGRVAASRREPPEPAPLAPSPPSPPPPRLRLAPSHPARAERVVDSVAERTVTPTHRARVAERRKRRDLRAKPRHLPFALARRARSRRASTRVIDARRGMKPRRRARFRTFVVRVNPPPHVARRDARRGRSSDARSPRSSHFPSIPLEDLEEPRPRAPVPEVSGGVCRVTHSGRATCPPRVAADVARAGVP